MKYTVRKHRSRSGWYILDPGYYQVTFSTHQRAVAVAHAAAETEARVNVTRAQIRDGMDLLANYEHLIKETPTS